MIISGEHGFVFLHIPKNAGTSVRRQLEPFDTSDGRFQATFEHEELGRLYGTHIPLKVLREHFPETFGEISGYRSFAIIREPKGRFRSALAQHLRERHQVELAHAPPELIGREAERAVMALETSDTLLPFEFTHFTPQHRYVDLDGERFTDELFLMDRVGQMFEVLSQQTGTQIANPARANETVSHRFPGLINAARRTNQRLRERLPPGPYKAVLNVAKPLLTKRPPAPSQAFPGGEAVERFVETFYERDFELYAELQSAPN